TIGIFVEGSNRINYIYNTFSTNGWAFKFSGGCDSNDITDNNFVNNSLDMMVSSSIQNNVIRGNYWSEYTGYDLNKDGVGDVPYYPVKLYSYILDQVPESIVLMRSMFVDLVNYSEKVSPVFTPKDVIDNSPKMSQVND
ncbi:MAG TPA: nitrous oxide reductase family maturation protein NosD, partial [Saprospiraceae bacterium]|nr:nitrous oxide reductase family maturation protein NosD [Saprospiraceae bacterium]